MKVKEMRQVLKNHVDVVTRSNKDVEALYNKIVHYHVGEVMPAALPDAGETWTYLGAGVTPPHTIKYMGIQHFIRGVPTIVTDPRVLERIGGNRSFAKGEVDMEQYFDQDELAAKRAQEILDEGLKLQIMIERENRKG